MDVSCSVVVHASPQKVWALVSDLPAMGALSRARPTARAPSASSKPTRANNARDAAPGVARRRSVTGQREVHAATRRPAG